MRILSKFAILALAAPILALAQGTGAVGLWKTIDDHTGKARALIRIVDVDGELHGTVEKLIRDPSEDPEPKCTKCDGSLKDQPVLGMTILWGLKKTSDAAVWSDGEIIDPDSGSVYHSKATLIENGQKLEVRGYVGLPLLGRTQTWVRVE